MGKNKHGGNSRSGSRPKKKNCCNNRWKSANEYSASAVVESEIQSSVNDALTPTNTPAQPNRPPNGLPDGPPNGPPRSRSAIKLNNIYEYDMEDSSSDESDNLVDIDPVTDNYRNTSGFRIIDINILNENLASNVVCKICHGQIVFRETECHGLGSKFLLKCENKKCDSINNKPFPSDPMISINQSNSLYVHSINRQSILAMRMIGGGLNDLKTFCGLMNLPPPVKKSSFKEIKNTIHNAVISAQDESMKRAGETEYKLSESNFEEDTESRDIDTSVDGTYMTRGFSAKCGVVSAIGCATGKVLDIGVKSKVCKSCDYWDKKDKNSGEYKTWKQKHEPECTISHEGSSGGMESAIGVEIFSRSEMLHKLRYSRFIGDGDTNSYRNVSKSKPYGDKPVIKIECVGHVQKRMGTRLRKLKISCGKRNLSDGKKIGGKGRLTDKQIDQIQTYYGNAIRGHNNDLKGMRRAIWSIYFHKLSTNDKPYHKGMCDIRWCKYLKAEQENKVLDHNNSLPEAVLHECKPIFRDLSHPDLLTRCLDGYTQNANESLNNTIWIYCPKRKYHGLQTVEIAVGLAVVVFNDGYTALNSVLEKMKISCGSFTKDFFRETDTIRIDKAEVRATEASLEARRELRNARRGRDETQAERDEAYQAGGH